MGTISMKYKHCHLHGPSALMLFPYPFQKEAKAFWKIKVVEMLVFIYKTFLYLMVISHINAFKYFSLECQKYLIFGDS